MGDTMYSNVFAAGCCGLGKPTLYGAAASWDEALAVCQSIQFWGAAGALFHHVPPENVEH